MKVTATDSIPEPILPSRLNSIHATVEEGILVLRGLHKTPHRRILFVSNYGMAKAWQLWQKGVYPGHHLWGCIELAIMGYEVLLPNPASGKGLVKRLKNDFVPALIAAGRLKSNDIVYCCHNILLWTPLLKAIRAVRSKIVGLVFAREPLFLASQYDGVIAHTPVAEQHIKNICPRAICSHISWGADLDFFQPYNYEPRWFLSCGKTFRDFCVISDAVHGLKTQVMIVYPNPERLYPMPSNVIIETVCKRNEYIYVPLAHYYYRYAAATLLTMQPDPNLRHSIGLTNLFESMACGRPAIVTRTSALTTEIDVEKSGIGLYVEPSDSESLKKAIIRLAENPEESREMGQRGRLLCEKHYNIARFSEDLHMFFEKL